MRFNKFVKVIAPALATVLALTGCAGGKTEPAAPEKAADLKPVTIRIYQWIAVQDEQWQQLYVEPVKKKYPHITLEPILRGKGTEPEELVAAGDFPDIITTNNDLLNRFKQLDLLTDLAPLVKQENIDLNRFDSSILERSKLKNELVSLPFNANFSVMFYNKDIFDKFAIPYPKDGMTWDETVELAKKVTRNEQGQQYRGFDPQSLYVLKSGLPIDVVDAKTELASLNNDQWKMALTIYKNLLTIPGNQQKGSSFANVSDGFLKDRNVAMIISNVMGALPDATKNGFNWDLAQAPSYKEYPNVSGSGQTSILAVAKSSKNKEDAMRVLNVLTSDEVQLLAAKKFGVASSLASKAAKDAFGADMPFLKGKNVQAIFKSKAGALMESSPYSGADDVRKVLDDKVKLVAADQKDVNTALREADEEVNKKLEQLKKK